MTAILQFFIGSRLGNLLLLGTILGSAWGITSWRLGNAQEDRDTAQSALKAEVTAHNTTRATLAAAATANTAYANTVKVLQSANEKLAAAKKLQAEQADAAIAAIDGKRRESDRVLGSWMNKYADAIRNPDCAKIMAMKSCVQ